MDSVFTPEQRRKIAGSARTLFERRDSPSNVSETELDEEYVDELIEEWRATFPDDEAFECRLDTDGLTESDCRELIRATHWPADEPLPDWLVEAERLVATVQATTPEEVETGVDHDGERPFYELFVGIVADARNRLPESTRTTLSDDALADAERWLFGRLEEAFTRLCFVQFKTFVALRDRDLAFTDPETVDDPPTEYYDAFVEQFYDGGFADLCVEHPVFPRLLVTRLDQWEHHVVELADRIERDREAIRTRFGDGSPLGRIRELEPLADDTHADGRAVTRLTFDSGCTVVYKPRSVDPGATFHELLGRLDDHLSVPSLASPTYLRREDYGWMEQLDYDDCVDEAAASRYYQRAGTLLAVAYAFGLTDCQVENLLAVGEHPVVVDAETVFHPSPIPERETRPDEFGAFLHDSVLSTHLLPWSVDGGHDADPNPDQPKLAGFGAQSEDATLTAYTTPSLTAINTDVLSIDYVHPTIERETNVPTADGEDQPPSRHLDTLVSGFETAYETIVELRDDGQLTDEIELFDAFEGVENRFIYRATNQYRSITQSLLSREALLDGARQSIEMERLAVPFFDGTVADEQLWPLYESERAALKRLDVPRFSCRPEGTAIERNGTETGVDVDRSGFDRARRRIESMDDHDRRRQLTLLRECFEHSSDVIRSGSAVSADARDERTTVEPTERRCREEAIRLFEQIPGATIDDEDRASWVFLATDPGLTGARLGVTDADLFAGRSGVALLPAALYRVTGEQAYRSFALETIDPIRQSIRSGDDVLAAGPGGGIGLPSVAYSLGVIGELVESQQLLDDAVAVAERLTDEAIAADDTFDVVGGNAGAILSLLGLFDRTGDERLRSRATRCGDQLLDARVEAESGGRAWPTDDASQPLTGFSHGAAGNAYALARLSDATGAERFATAAEDAIAYESGTFSEQEQNWPDFRAQFDGTYQDQWCHGRSGIGLARIGTAAAGLDDALPDARTASETTSTEQLQAYDHVCCGNFGRVEFLLEAADAFGEDRSAARDLAGRILSRKETVGQFFVPGNAGPLVDPTFFQGTAGVGYSLLRLHHSETLPCILAWE